MGFSTRRTARNEKEQWVYDRLTTPDDQRAKDDPIRKIKYDPCCIMHKAGVVCIREAGHR